jgi:hypothetical protein
MADLEPPPDTPVHPNFNEKTPVRRVIGPASYAIDGKDDTAWSNDVGPGRRNQECTAVFVLEQPIVNPGGSQLTIRLTQKHGGWNSDDLQGNNLGRFRISIASAVPGAIESVPKRVRDALAVPRAERSPLQNATIFSYLAHDSSGMEGSERKNRRALEGTSRGCDTTASRLRAMSDAKPTCSREAIGLSRLALCPRGFPRF